MTYEPYLRLLVPSLLLLGALACFWAAFSGKTFYERELLGPGKPMPRWKAGLMWTLCGALLLLAVFRIVA